jgi:hypothetical protein
MKIQQYVCVFRLKGKDRVQGVEVSRFQGEKQRIKVKGERKR